VHPSFPTPNANTFRLCQCGKALYPAFRLALTFVVSHLVYSCNCRRLAAILSTSDELAQRYTRRIGQLDSDFVCASVMYRGGMGIEYDEGVRFGIQVVHCPREG
jgi:hypothetical protein